MFIPILQIRFLPLDIKTKRSVRGTGAAVMDSFGRWDKNYLPLVRPETLAPIHIFTEDKKSFIQQADLRHSFSSDHPKAAKENIDRPETILLPMSQRVAS